MALSNHVPRSRQLLPYRDYGKFTDATQRLVWSLLFDVGQQFEARLVPRPVLNAGPSLLCRRRLEPLVPLGPRSP